MSDTQEKDNIIDLAAAQAKQEAAKHAKRGDLLSVPQAYPDAYGLAVEPNEVAVTLASRFQPYRDGTVELQPIPFQVLRLPAALARSLAENIIKQLDKVAEAVKQNEELFKQAQAEAALAAALKKDPEAALAAALKKDPEAPAGE